MLKVVFIYEKGSKIVCEDVTKIEYNGFFGSPEVAEGEEILTRHIPIGGVLSVYTPTGTTSISSSGLRAIERSEEN